MSTAWTLLAYSWPTRWNTRSAPVRSTRTSMPPNFSLKEAAIFSDTERSMEVYQTTLPSFFAASINCGVMASGGGAAARAGVANTVPSASAVEPLSEVFRMSRLDNFRFCIAFSSASLTAQRPATFRRQRQPDLGAPRHRVVGRRHHAQGGAIWRFYHVVAAGTEKDLTRHRGLDGILAVLRRLRRELDVMLADRDHAALARGEL